MTASSRTNAHTHLSKILWRIAVGSWIGSAATGIGMLAAGVQLDWTPILLWTLIIVHLTFGAIIVSAIPSAEVIIARAYIAAHEDELSTRRGG
jgi:hypothetical protein